MFCSYSIAYIRYGNWSLVVSHRFFSSVLLPDLCIVDVTSGLDVAYTGVLAGHVVHADMLFLYICWSEQYTGVMIHVICLRYVGVMIHAVWFKIYFYCNSCLFV